MLCINSANQMHKGADFPCSFLTIFYKMDVTHTPSPIPSWTGKPSLHAILLLLKKYEAPEGGFPTVLYK